MPNKLLIATTNKGKQDELFSLFGDLPYHLSTPQDQSLSLKVKETGTTYAENARLKARAYCEVTGLPTLADDSGLEVEILEGAPGLYSARFSPKLNATDADRRALLISKLQKFPQPWKARFVCSMAFTLPDGSVYFSEGICDGEINPVERGEFGFGYDPIFLCVDASRTMAELKMPHKNRISHRGKAAEGIRPIITSFLDS